MEGRQADQIEFATGVKVGEPSKWRHKTNSTSQFNRVAVFCGASSGTSPIYMEVACASEPQKICTPRTFVTLHIFFTVVKYIVDAPESPYMLQSRKHCLQTQLWRQTL